MIARLLPTSQYIRNSRSFGNNTYRNNNINRFLFSVVLENCGRSYIHNNGAHRIRTNRYYSSNGNNNQNNEKIPDSLKLFNKPQGTHPNETNPDLNLIQLNNEKLKSANTNPNNIIPPQQKVIKNVPLTNSHDLSYLQDAIIQQQASKQRKTAGYSFLIILLGSFFGYTIGYKVLYLQEESFWPLYPLSDKRDLTTRDYDNIDTESIYELASQQVLYKLQINEYINKHYEIPLKILDNHKGLDDVTKLFDKMWFEDASPDTFKFKIIKFKPYDVNNYKLGYHAIGPWIQFKLVNKSFIKFQKIWNNILGNEEVYQLIHDSKLGDKDTENEDDEMMLYKHDTSIKKHETELWFLNEFRLSQDDSRIIYKGKCVHNCDVSITQIDLVTKNKSDGKSTRYIIYKDNKDSSKH